MVIKSCPGLNSQQMIIITSGLIITFLVIILMGINVKKSITSLGEFT